jgi:competence protein ComGC
MGVSEKKENVEKKIVLIAFVLLLGIPFVMQRSAIPFWHFGMFAAPKAVQAQRKAYAIKQNGRPLSPTEFQMSESLFQALARKHAYTPSGKAFFLQELVAIYKKQNPKVKLSGKWDFCQGDSSLYAQNF